MRRRADSDSCADDGADGQVTRGGSECVRSVIPTHHERLLVARHTNVTNDDAAG